VRSALAPHVGRSGDPARLENRAHDTTRSDLTEFRRWRDATPADQAPIPYEQIHNAGLIASDLGRQARSAQKDHRARRFQLLLPAPPEDGRLDPQLGVVELDLPAIQTNFQRARRGI
jgi:hypothetical protein